MKKKVIGIAVVLLAAIGAFAQPYPPNVLPGTAGESVIYYNTRTLGPSGSNSIVMNFYITTNNVDYFTVNTNTFITFITNATFNQNINVSGKAQINTLIITNGVGYYTNVWAGPTNNVDMSLSSPYDLNYASFTKCEIEGIIGKSNQITSEKLLQIYNLSATNFNVTFTNGFVISAAGVITNTCTVSNATAGLFWLRYSPQAGAGPRTNGVYNDL